MPLIDPAASLRVRELREAQGLSPEELARAIAKWARAKGPEWTRGSVDAYTIRRIEGKPPRPGFVPGTRVRFVLASYFGMDHRDIWMPGRQAEVPSERRLKVAA